MRRFLVTLDVPVAGYFHSAESYGEGLFAAVSGLALEAGQGYRIVQLDVEYMKTSAYDINVAQLKVKLAKSLKYKFFFVAMAQSQWSHFHKALDREGMLNSKDIQLVGSESITSLVSAGMVKFLPMSQGPLFAKFTEMWLKMKASDVVGPEAIKRYAVNSWRVGIGSPLNKNTPPTDEMFENINDPDMLYVPFIFDAAYCFVISANEMLNAGVEVTNIKGKALLDKVRASNFEGISGTSVVFNKDGDRLASYFIQKLKNQNAQTGRRLRSQASEGSMLRRLSTRAWVTVAEFSAATDEIIMGSSNTFHWSSGHKGPTLPADFFACAHGFRKDQRGMCVQCQIGSWTLSNHATKCELLGELCNEGYTYDTSKASCTACPTGKFWGPTGCFRCMAGTITTGEASTKCNGCGTGTYQNMSGKSACVNCPAGHAAGEVGMAQCRLCKAGTFSANSGTETCTLCRSGKYQPETGASECISCPLSSVTQEVGTIDKEKCMCPRDTRLDEDRCVACPAKGVYCPGGHSIFANSADTTPLLMDGFMSKFEDVWHGDSAIYTCVNPKRCAGQRSPFGGAEICTGNFDPDSPRCFECHVHNYVKDDTCKERGVYGSLGDSVWKLCLSELMGLLVLLYLYLRFNRPDPAFAIVGGSVLNFVQVCQTMRHMQLDWPPSVQLCWVMMDALTPKFVHENLFRLKPECISGPGWEPLVIGNALLPLKPAIYLACLFALSFLTRRRRRFDFFMNTGCIVYKTVMITITHLTLNIWLTETMPNGEVMVKSLPMEYMSSEWKAACPWSLVGFVLYCVLFMAYTCHAVWVAPSWAAVWPGFADRYRFAFGSLRPERWWFILPSVAFSQSMVIAGGFLVTAYGKR